MDVTVNPAEIAGVDPDFIVKPTGVDMDINVPVEDTAIVAWPPQLVVACYWRKCYLRLVLAKKWDFTSKRSTFVPRNGQVTGSDLCHDPPQAKREWEDGWEGKWKGWKAGAEGGVMLVVG